MLIRKTLRNALRNIETLTQSLFFLSQTHRPMAACDTWWLCTIVGCVSSGWNSWYLVSDLSHDTEIIFGVKMNGTQKNERSLEKSI